MVCDIAKPCTWALMVLLGVVSGVECVQNCMGYALACIQCVAEMTRLLRNACHVNAPCALLHSTIPPTALQHLRMVCTWRTHVLPLCMCNSLNVGATHGEWGVVRVLVWIRGDSMWGFGGCTRTSCHCVHSWCHGLIFWLILHAIFYMGIRMHTSHNDCTRTRVARPHACIYGGMKACGMTGCRSRACIHVAKPLSSSIDGCMRRHRGCM